jgi:hypothetical protein
MSLLNTNKDMKWPGMKIWNFANFFYWRCKKKNHDSRHSEADFFSEPWMYRLKESSPYSGSTSLGHFLNLDLCIPLYWYWLWNDFIVLNTNKDKKWPGMKIWNFANFFYWRCKKKNHIFPQFFGYITIYLVPVGGRSCLVV